MTDELRNMIRQSAEEEKQDIDKYKRMAEMAEENGENKIAGVLRDIDHDEKTHRHLLEQMMW